MTYEIPFTELAATDGPLPPDECAALARRAAGLLDPAALAQARPAAPSCSGRMSTPSPG